MLHSHFLTAVMDTYCAFCRNARFQPRLQHTAHLVSHSLPRTPTLLPYVVVRLLLRCQLRRTEGGTRALSTRQAEDQEVWRRVNLAEEEHDHAADEKAVARLQRLEKL